MGEDLELPRVTSSHRAYPKSVQIIRRMSIRPWGLLHSCGVDAMEKQARIGEVKCTVLKGTKSRHTDVLRCACAGVVETIVYSRLETIFSIAVCIRSDGTCDVLGKSCSTVNHESGHADMRCFHRVPGSKQAWKVKKTDVWSGTIGNAKAEGMVV